jgi:hypothetical protein
MICVSGAKIYRIITSNIRGPIILCGHMGKECRKHFKITKLLLVLLKPENFGAEIKSLIPSPLGPHAKIFILYKKGH